jgi:tetratricopeptide (TPR) repeat protein
MLRVIREVEPPAPSSRISTSEALPSLAASRGVEPARLSRLVRGDLDWIVMKALAKERERRYASAVGLADDLERFLNHEPVSAVPPTTAYRLRKFVRRNRVRLAAAGLVLLALGVVGTTLGLIEARRQQGIALDEAKAKEEARRAEAELRRLADEQRREAEKRLAQVTKVIDSFGSIFKDLNPTNAQKEKERDPLVVARMQAAQGHQQLDLGYPDRAIALFTKACATFSARLGPDHPETLEGMNDLAISYRAAGQNDRAVKLLEEMLALKKAKLGPDHPETLTSMNDLAISHADAGQHERALKLYEETVALRRSRLGPDHPCTLQSLEGQARCLTNSGQLDRAGAILDEVIAARRKAQGDDHPDTFLSRLARAEVDLARGRLDAAETADRAILDECRSRLGADHGLRIAAGLALARVRQARGDRDTAAALLRAALEAARKNPTDRETLATALAESGRSGLKAGDWTAAEAPLREALAIREVERPQHWLTAEVRSLLGGALFAQKKTAEAAPLLRSGYEGMARSAAAIPLVDRPRLAEAIDRLSAAGEAAGTNAEVAAWKAERAKLGVGGPKP